jgi:hypothetical protein
MIGIHCTFHVVCILRIKYVHEKRIKYEKISLISYPTNPLNHFFFCSNDNFKRLTPISYPKILPTINSSNEKEI